MDEKVETREWFFAQIIVSATEGAAHVRSASGYNRDDVMKHARQIAREERREARANVEIWVELCSIFDGKLNNNVAVEVGF